MERENMGFVGGLHCTSVFCADFGGFCGEYFTGTTRSGIAGAGIVGIGCWGILLGEKGAGVICLVCLENSFFLSNIINLIKP
jgi:hypothetical protein